jgi:hypothetical protein
MLLDARPGEVGVVGTIPHVPFMSDELLDDGRGWCSASRVVPLLVRCGSIAGMSERFSERMGIQKRPVGPQLGTMDDALTNRLWNTISAVFDEEQVGWQFLCRRLAGEHLTLATDTVPWEDNSRSRVWTRKRFYESGWAAKYDLLEYIADNIAVLSFDVVDEDTFKGMANSALSAERSGYRFVAGILAPMDDPVEVAEIDAAASRADAGGLKGVRAHIGRALELLAQRPTPDVRNSMKEAISAVESAVKSIQGVRGGGLEGPLDALGERVQLHPAFRAGLVKFFGFTSDEDGVRHAIMEEPTVDEADARFMIVTCSAAAHWIITKAQAAGLLRQ